MAARPGVSSMALALLTAGIFAVLAGLLAILFGFTVREFSLGSTLIIAGTVGVCSGLLLAGLHVGVLALNGISRWLAGGAAASAFRAAMAERSGRSRAAARRRHGRAGGVPVRAAGSAAPAQPDVRLDL